MKPESELKDNDKGGTNSLLTAPHSVGIVSMYSYNDSVKP